MTKIYTYCLFDHQDIFYGVYSSLKSVHRDALKICNKGQSKVFVEHRGIHESPTLTGLRNMFKGECDIVIKYISDSGGAKILKTKLKE